jgi:hypothetical protein
LAESIGFERGAVVLRRDDGHHAVLPEQAAADLGLGPKLRQTVIQVGNPSTGRDPTRPYPSVIYRPTIAICWKKLENLPGF